MLSTATVHSDFGAYFMRATKEKKIYQKLIKLIEMRIERKGNFGQSRIKQLENLVKTQCVLPFDKIVFNYTEKERLLRIYL